MALHTDTEYELDGVRLGSPDAAEIRDAVKDADVAMSVDKWLERAQRDPSIHYFASYEGATLVGQIFLHDVDLRTREALVGYHLFERRFRGRGIGTRMLALLQRYVREQTPLRRVVAITDRANAASQRIALKCGFVHTGPPREDPANGMCFEWRVPRTGEAA